MNLPLAFTDVKLPSQD